MPVRLDMRVFPKSRIARLPKPLQYPALLARSIVRPVKKFKYVYLSVRGKNTSEAEAAATAIRAMREERGLPDLQIWFFDSESARVWGAQKQKAA